MTTPFEAKIVARELDGQTFDTALPQDWVDAAISRTGHNPVSHVVWLYPKGQAFGYPRAIDATGDWIVGVLAAGGILA